jgi:molecular chaperone DnaK (HSP70)
MADIGIDLGTTNSVVAHLQNEPKVIENRGRQWTPSVVAWDDGELLVGQAAKDEAIALPSVFSWKRHIGTDMSYDLGGHKYTPVDLSAMILRQLKEAAEERLAEPIDGAVITIPAYFSGAQKEATKRAGEQAGLKNVRLLAEPIAAALAYGAEDTVLVYDLGGGTFDVAIIDCFDYKMLGLDGDNYLGGDDFDKKLMTHLADEVKKQTGADLESSRDALQIARTECEKAKIKLSDRESATIRLQAVIGGTPVNVSVKVTREEFERMIADLVEKSLEKVEGAIAKAREKDESFSKADIDTVLLVGGSTYVPLVQQRLGEYFGKPASKKVNPDLAVGLGAAVHTASGSIEKGVHRVRLDPIPMVTAATQCTIKGRTSPGARIEVRGGATTASGEADSGGRFSFPIELTCDATNDIVVVATSLEGEQRKTGCQIRHDASFSGEEQKGRRKTIGVGGGVTPRTLGIRVTGNDDILGVIIPEQTEIPCSVTSRNYCITSQAPNMPGQALIEIYEGEVPYSVLNTQLASLMLETAASPSTQEPLEILFQITEDHLLTVTARMVNFPDRVVTSKVSLQSPSGDKLSVLDRFERLMRVHGDKIRPEKKASLNKSKLGLVDLCDQFKREAQPDRYGKIKEIGSKLREEIASLESQYH